VEHVTLMRHTDENWGVRIKMRHIVWWWLKWSTSDWVKYEAVEAKLRRPSPGSVIWCWPCSWLCPLCTDAERITCSRLQAHSQSASLLPSSRWQGRRGDVDTTPYWTGDVTDWTTDVANDHAVDWSATARYYVTLCHVVWDVRWLWVSNTSDDSVQSKAMNVTVWPLYKLRAGARDESYKTGTERVRRWRVETDCYKHEQRRPEKPGHRQWTVE